MGYLFLVVALLSQGGLLLSMVCPAVFEEGLVLVVACLALVETVLALLFAVPVLEVAGLVLVLSVGGLALLAQSLCLVAEVLCPWVVDLSREAASALVWEAIEQEVVI